MSTTLRLYHDGDITVSAIIKLGVAASHHLLHVLRAKTGSDLLIFNGNGSEYVGTLLSIENKQAIIRISSQHTPSRESPVMITLGQGISRGDRMDYAVQKSVELGESKITPLLTQRCQPPLKKSRLDNRLAHWRSIVIGACEQSGRCVIPELSKAEPLDAWLPTSKGGLCVVCDPGATQHFSHLPESATQITLLIGPEGGFTQSEIQQAKSVGFIGVSLGPRILRTETAAVVALALLQSRYGGLVQLNKVPG